MPDPTEIRKRLRKLVREARRDWSLLGDWRADVLTEAIEALEAAERREEGLREAARALLDAMYEHGPDGAEIARAADRLEALLDTPEEEGERDG